MSDPTQPRLPPSLCAYPGCTVVLQDSEGVIHHPGGACPEHRAWFDEQVAACNAGEPAAMERYALEPSPEADPPTQGELAF